MFNHLQLTVLTILLSTTISVTSSSKTRDLINFNVYQTGSRIHGHYKYPNGQVKVNFQLDQVNSTHYTFSLTSGQPNPFDVSGNWSLIELDDGLVELKGKAISSAVQVNVSVDAKIKTMTNGHQVETEIGFNITDTRVKYSLGLDLLDNCWPLTLRHNISTVPVGLISYNSGVNGYCDRGQRTENNLTLFAELGSTLWTDLNSTLTQYWIFNSTGGSERMTFSNQNVGVMIVTNSWTNTPIPITRKKAIFISNSTLVPSFDLLYSVDGGKRSFTYETIEG